MFLFCLVLYFVVFLSVFTNLLYIHQWMYRSDVWSCKKTNGTLMRIDVRYTVHQAGTVLQDYNGDVLYLGAFPEEISHCCFMAAIAPTSTECPINSSYRVKKTLPSLSLQDEHFILLIYIDL